MTARRSLRAGLRGASCYHNDMSSRAARLPWHWAAALSVALAVVLAGAAGHRPARAGSASPPAAAVPPLALTDRSAKILGVVPGDRVELSASAAGPWRTFRVAAVYQPAVYPTEISRTRVDVRLHLADLQALVGTGDVADSVIVRVRPPARAADVVARLNALPLGFRAYTSADLASRASTTFEVIARFHRAISVVTILASSVFLLAIMTLRGEEMRRQVGVMRLMGISRRTIAAVVLLVAAAIALAGSLVGVALGYGLSALINVYYRTLFDTPLLFSQITPPLVLQTVVLSVALGLAAGAATAWRLLRRPPLEQVGR